MQQANIVFSSEQYKGGVTEAEWRSGQALRPYFDDVSLLVKNKQVGYVRDGALLAHDE